MLIPMLLKAGHTVVVLDNLMFGGQSLLPYFIHPSFEFYRVDVCDRKTLEPSFTEFVIVIHWRHWSGTHCVKKCQISQKVNVDGAQNIVDLTPPHTLWFMLQQEVIMEKLLGFMHRKYTLEPFVSLW